MRHILFAATCILLGGSRSIAASDPAFSGSKGSPGASVSTPSSALKTSLRAQILELVPRLRHGESFGEGADVLALSMAQLGDLEAAWRLATRQWTRDSINVWRVEQLAFRREYAKAALLAQGIAHRGTRADSLLLIARLAFDRRDWDGGRPALRAAMQSLDKAPDSGQLSYAAWLWGQSGDHEAARRVLWKKAWPRALKEDELASKEQEPYRSRFPRNGGLVLDFASELGFLPDVLERQKSLSAPAMSWVVMRAHSSSDFNLLRRNLETTAKPAPHLIMTLAMAAARLGMTAEAHELRDRARLQVQNLPVDIRSERSAVLHMEMILASMLREDDEFDKAQSELEKANSNLSPIERDELTSVALLLRISSFGNANRFVPRFDVEPARLEATATAILAATPSRAQFEPLKILAQIYGRRRNLERLQQIAAVTARNVERQSQEYYENRAKGKGSWWEYGTTEIASLLREVQPGLESPILDALLAKTPRIFRSSTASQLYQNGLPDTARKMFDPLQAILEAATLSAAIRRETNEVKRRQLEQQQINFSWEDYAASEARSDPQAPARWIAAISDDQTRVQVIRAWTSSFYPVVPLKPPYVRRIGGSSSYRVGGGAGSSIGG